MGVPGLWDIIHVVGTSTAIGRLAVLDGFQHNVSNRRGYRIGIDASIWLHHASFCQGGENPGLRLLFFRVLNLLRWPILPLFMFDGRARPKTKRGSKLGKSGSHALTKDFKTMLSLMGVEWREAAGEAEAELAQLNRYASLDAVMTDDVDAFLFGAQTVIKNPGINLSGNKSKPAIDKRGKASKHHVWVYTADAIQSHPGVRMTRGGMILFALLNGGDYHTGVDKIGKVIAHGLARCGFGDSLLTAYQNRNSQDIRTFLTQWRAEMTQELHTNSKGFLPHICASTSIPDTFPDMGALKNYVEPAVFATQAGRGGGGLRDARSFNIAALAAFCEEKFGEWGFRDVIIKRFRTLVWPSAVMHLLRHSTLDRDEKPIRNGVRPPAVGTPASLVQKYLGGPVSIQRADAIADAFINKGTVRPAVQPVDDTYPLGLRIVRSRQHVSTDEMLEYLVEFSPIQFVELANSGIKGFRGASPTNDSEELDENGNVMVGARTTGKLPPPPRSAVQLWIPSVVLAEVYPELGEEFRSRPTRANRRAPLATQGRVATEPQDEDMSDTITIESSPPRRARPSRQPYVGSTSTQPMARPSPSADIPIQPQTPSRTQPKVFVFEGRTYIDVNPAEVNARSENQPPSAPAPLQRVHSIIDLTNSPARPSRQSAHDTFSTTASAPGPTRYISRDKYGSTSSQPTKINYGGTRDADLMTHGLEDPSDEEEMPRSRFDDIFEQLISKKRAPTKRAGQRRPRNTRRTVEPFSGRSEPSVSQPMPIPSASQGLVSTRPTPNWRPSARVRAPVAHVRDLTGGRAGPSSSPGLSLSQPLPDVAATRAHRSPIPFNMPLSQPSTVGAAAQIVAHSSNVAQPWPWGSDASPPGQPSCGARTPNLRADPSSLTLPRAEYRHVARSPDALDVFLAQNPSPRDLGDVNNGKVNSGKRPGPPASQPPSTLKRAKSNQENRSRPRPRPIRPPVGAANRVVSAPAPLPKFKPPPGLFLRGMWDSDDDDMPSLPSGQPTKHFPLPRPSVGDQMPSSSQDSALYDGDIIDLTDY
ncbi:XPG-I domain-containing protein [Pleurotus pulmonarius]